jgi:arsenate reductase
MSKKPNVLFLCTHNSARSQMAEALLRDMAGDRFEVHSAGTEATRVNPMVAPVMEELGIDVSAQRSKSLDEYLGHLNADHVIIVCANAEKVCPRIFPGLGDRLFWPFDDPAAVEGTDEEKKAAFRRVRDQIAERLRAWLAGTPMG